MKPAIPFDRNRRTAPGRVRTIRGPAGLAMWLKYRHPAVYRTIAERAPNVIQDALSLAALPANTRGAFTPDTEGSAGPGRPDFVGRYVVANARSLTPRAGIAQFQGGFAGDGFPGAGMPFDFGPGHADPFANRDGFALGDASTPTFTQRILQSATDLANAAMPLLRLDADRRLLEAQTRRAIANQVPSSATTAEGAAAAGGMLRNVALIGAAVLAGWLLLRRKRA